MLKNYHYHFKKKKKKKNLFWWNHTLLSIVLQNGCKYVWAKIRVFTLKTWTSHHLFYQWKHSLSKDNAEQLSSLPIDWIWIIFSWSLLLSINYIGETRDSTHQNNEMLAQFSDGSHRNKQPRKLLKKSDIISPRSYLIKHEEILYYAGYISILHFCFAAQVSTK